jgi:hypothetical protein
MFGRYFVPRSPGQFLVILAAALLLHHPFTANAQVKLEASGGLLLGIPSGDFGDNISETAIGGVLAAGIQLPQSPVFLGVELGYVVYGRVSREEAFNSATPDVRIDVVTTNNIFQGNLLLRLQRPTGKVRPYLDGLVGFNYLFTETAVTDDEGWLNTIADYVNFDDWALTYGFGGGAAFALWERQSGSDSGKIVPTGVYLDLGVRYLFGAEAEYLEEGAIQIVGGQATFQPEQSKTDMIYPHFRIRVAF